LTEVLFRDPTHPAFAFTTVIADRVNDADWIRVAEQIGRPVFFGEQILDALGELAITEQEDHIGFESQGETQRLVGGFAAIHGNSHGPIAKLLFVVRGGIGTA